MKILILGGTGAMGKPLVEILNAAGRTETDILVTSRSPYPSKENVKYLVGNARDNIFLSSLLYEKPDAIVDFMNYDLDEFAARIPMLLGSTKHYIWFSSCRVYAESDKPLTESSPRLLETSCDKDFLATNRYALRKARQEDLLKNSGFNNYTIIRPYITYNDERLQLGILEKEQWLYRLLNGKPLVVSETMLDKTTTLSHGDDVAAVVAKLIGNDNALEQTIQIAGPHTVKWIDLLKNIYIPILQKYINVPPTYCSDSIKAIEMLYEGGYNTIYDCNYDRVFDSSKIDRLVGPVSYKSIEEGIGSSLTNFLDGERKFLHIDPIYEAYQDILTDTMSDERYFDNIEDFETYKRYRNKPLSDIEGLEDNKKVIL